MNAESRLTLGFMKAHPVEAARRLETLSAPDASELLMELPPADVALVLEHCLPGPASKIVTLFPLETTSHVIAELSTASAIGVLRQLDELSQADVLEQLEQAVGSSLRRAMRYPPDTAASYADPRVLTLPPDVTVAQGLARARLDLRNTTYYVYIIDRDTKLEGLVTLKQLIASEPTQVIASMMTDNVVTLAAEASIDEILQHPQWEQFHTLPVVDRWGTFLGALRYRTLRGIQQDHVLNPDPGPLNQALIQLWEVYALAGIGMMTDIVNSFGAPSSTDARPLSRMLTPPAPRE